MHAKLFEQVSVRLKDQTVELEIQWISRDRKEAPLIVFLHEGLGSIAMWEDWPRQLCKAAGCRGLVFSRYGYGGSARRPAKQEWPLDYLEQEAYEVLPALFEVLGIDVAADKPILFGHSDGGTIALLHAAAFTNCVAGIITVAPHVYVEDVGLARIAHLQQTYSTGTRREILSRFHNDDPDSVFCGWSKRWRDDEFRTWNITRILARISCPVLAVQGAQDQYGTIEQVLEIQRRIPQTELVIINDCRHVPHQDQPQALLDCAVQFIGKASLTNP